MERVAGFSSEHGDSERRFLLDAIGYLRDLDEGGLGQQVPANVWLLRRPGYPARDAVLSFPGSSTPWLRELIKR